MTAFAPSFRTVIFLLCLNILSSFSLWGGPSKKIGLNGANGLVGPKVMHFLLSQEHDVSAWYFIPPKEKEALPKKTTEEFRNWFFQKAGLASAPSNLQVYEGDLLDREAVKQMVEGQDVFFHIAGVPIHYAKQELAPNIFAVDAIGSALVALATHSENQKRKEMGKEPLRLIMFSSISSKWISKWIKTKLSPKNREALTIWTRKAATDFLDYSNRYFERGSEEPSPISFAKAYLGREQGLFDLVNSEQELRKFDYYALSKLLMDEILKILAEKGAVVNTVVIRPVSLLGTGLQNKDDPGFIAKATAALIKKEPYPIWDRTGFYIPLSVTMNILDELMTFNRDQMSEPIAFINLPGLAINQHLLFTDYILPNLKEILKMDSGLAKKLQLDPDQLINLGEVFPLVPSPTSIDLVREVSPKIHPLIAKTHRITQKRMKNEIRNIMLEIVKDEASSRF